MNKKLTAWLWLGLISPLSTASAFEMPHVLDKALIDDILEWGTQAIQPFLKDGVANILYNSMEKDDHHEDRTFYRFQIAGPIFNKMVAPRYLYRVEANYIRFSNAKELNIFKIGCGGRYMINPHFILGGYTFFDFIKLQDPSWTRTMLNLGIESIWSRGYTVTIDMVQPHNILFSNANDRFYQYSIKTALLKPYTFELGTALSVVKYPNYTPSWHGDLSIKGNIPWKRWKINQLVTLRGGLRFRTPGGKFPAICDIKNPRNYSGFGSMQINILPQKSQGSLRDYLRIPIDRAPVTPYNPNHYPVAGRLNTSDIPMTPPMSPDLGSSFSSIYEEEAYANTIAAQLLDKPMQQVPPDPMAPIKMLDLG